MMPDKAEIVTSAADNESKRSYVPLLPGDVRRLRLALAVNNNSGHATQELFCMIMLSIACFLTADEIIRVKVEDFDMNYATGSIVQNSDHIQSLVLKVPSGGEVAKSEQQESDMNKPVHLQLLRNDQYPEFCAVRAVLSWIKASGIQNGYLFRSVTDASEHVSHDSFLNRLQTKLTNLFPEYYGEKAHGVFNQVGTKTLRKTAYLFALWGCFTRQKQQAPNLTDSDLALILKAARHESTIEEASHDYISDFPTLYRLLQIQRDYQHQVSPWHGIYLEPTTMPRPADGCSLKRAPNDSEGDFRVPTVVDQAEAFFRAEIGMTQFDSFVDYYAAACSKRTLPVPHPESIEAQLEEILGRCEDLTVFNKKKIYELFELPPPSDLLAQNDDEIARVHSSPPPRKRPRESTGNNDDM